jgi:hypothetical protein
MENVMRMETKVRIWMIVVMVGILVWLLTVRAVSQPAAVVPPFEYDPNQCAGAVMDYAYCDPNVSVIYGVRFYTQSGRPAEQLSVWSGPDGPIDAYVRYDGMVKDPNGPGWWHEWQVGMTPRRIGTLHVNLRAWYKPKRGYSDAWSIPPGQKEQDTRTILLKVTESDEPYLMPGLTPTPVARLKRAQRFWVQAQKDGVQFTKPTRVLR